MQCSVIKPSGAPAHPAQPIGVRPPRETNRLNPYGTTSLAMMLFMTCLVLANFIFFDREFSIALPTGVPGSVPWGSAQGPSL